MLKCSYMDIAMYVFFSLNIFYCQNIYSNGVWSQVLTTLVSTLPLHSIYTQKLINMAIYTNTYANLTSCTCNQSKTDSNINKTISE